MSVFGNDYPCHYIIHTQHDCPSQMNSSLLINVTKLTYFYEILIKMQDFSFEFHLTIPSAKWRPFLPRCQCVNISPLRLMQPYPLACKCRLIHIMVVMLFVTKYYPNAFSTINAEIISISFTLNGCLYLKYTEVIDQNTKNAFFSSKPRLYILLGYVRSVPIRFDI